MMRRLFFIAIFLIAANAWGQLKQSEAMTLFDLKRLVGNITQPSSSPQCHESEEQVNEVEILCELDQECETPPEMTGIASIMNIEELPEELQETIQQHYPGIGLESAWAFTFNVRWINDNDYTDGILLWLLRRDFDGSDMEFTHGLSFNGEWINSKLIRYSAEIQTNLYTQHVRNGYNEPIIYRRANDIDGRGNPRRIEQQNFVNETIFKLWKDNIAQGKSYFYRAGIGFILLDPQNSKGLLRASGQQQWWHENVLDIYSFENITNDQQVIRMSPDFEASLGLQHNLTNARNNCRLRLSGHVGGKINFLGGSEIKVGAEQKFYLQKANSRHLLRVKAKQDIALHGKGVSRNYSYSISYMLRPMEIQLGYMVRKGKTSNIQGFDTENSFHGGLDPLFVISLGFHLH